MNNKQKMFLSKLADLMDEYNVSMGYTTDDDGIHFYMGLDDFHTAWLDDAKWLRADLDANHGK